MGSPAYIPDTRPGAREGDVVVILDRPAEPDPVAAVSIIRASSIRPEPIEWLWRGWLAAGKVHIVAGAPGTGKTTIALALAATITIGGRWPDGTRAEPGDVMIWSGEDDPRDTLVPRLMAAGADLDRVHIVSSCIDADGPRPFDPSRDMALLSAEIAAMERPPRLLAVDPIVSAVQGDSHKNAEVRRALQPLADLAMVRRCAVLGITHFSKSTAGRDPIDRVTGSLAFGALARIVLATAKLPEGEGGERILARAKSNLSADTGGWRYDLDVVEAAPGIETTRALWGEAVEGSARELLSRAETVEDVGESSQTSEATDWLTDILVAGPMKARDVQKEAREAGISDKALRTARERLGIRPRKAGFSAGWLWALPTEDAQDDPKAPKVPALRETASSAPSGRDGHLRGAGEAIEEVDL